MASPHQLASLLDTYVRTAADLAQEAGLPTGWCITAAGVSHEVLTRLGLPGVRVIGVDIEVLNLAAWRLMRTGVAAKYWPDAALSAGTAGTDHHDRDGWDGHAVAYIPAKSIGGNTAWIVDPSVGQFSNPSAGLTVHPLYAPVTPDFLTGTPCEIATTFGGLRLRRNPRLTLFRTELPADRDAAS